MERSITVAATHADLADLMDFVMTAARHARLSKKQLYRVRLVVEEIVTNITHYGYEDTADGVIECQAVLHLDEFRLTLADRGRPFDLRHAGPPSNLDASAEEREPGGLGILLALEGVDHYDYQQLEGWNISRLGFRVQPRSISRTMAVSKTSYVDQLNSMLMSNAARLFTDVQGLEAETRKLQKQGVALSPRLLELIGSLHKHVRSSRDNTERVIGQLAQFQKLLDVTTMLDTSLQTEQVIQAAVENALRLSGASYTCLLLRQPDGSLHAAAALEHRGDSYEAASVAYDESLVQVCIERGALSYAAQGSIAAPLLYRNEASGVLYLRGLTYEPESETSQDLQLLLNIFTTQVAVAIENAQLFESSRNEARLERDMQIAQEIQAGFLPKQLPSMPGWESAAYFYPARQVAGDFYDVFAISHDRLGLVVGDVCDKGLGAALFMALFRSLIRAFAQQNNTGSWMDDLLATTSNRTSLKQRRSQLSAGAIAMKNAIMMTNDYIAINHSDANMFATMFFGIIDPERGTLMYINGGHNPPLLVGADGSIRQELAVTGPAVGMLPGMEFDIEQTFLAPGDRLVCFTDGLTEAKNTAGDFFTEERLLSLVKNQPATTASDLVARLKAAVHLHIGSAEQFDDLTLLVLQRLSSAADEDALLDRFSSLRR